MLDYRVIFARSALAAAGMAGGLLVASSGTADAQFFGWWNNPTTYGAPANAMISPAQIYRLVAARGYQVTGGLRSDGRVYTVDVVDRWGRPLRLVVDAYEGDILQRFATRPPRPAALIPQQPQIGELFAPPPAASEAYPPYPNSAVPARPAARQQTKIPGLGHPAEAHRKPVKKTQTATRENGAPQPLPGTAQPGPASHADTVASPVGHTARTEAEPQPPADSIVPKAAVTIAPAKDAVVPPPAKADKVTAAVAPQSPVQATPRAPVVAPAPAVTKPARGKTDGPGYANGVPINPLD